MISLYCMTSIHNQNLEIIDYPCNSKQTFDDPVLRERKQTVHWNFTLIWSHSSAQVFPVFFMKHRFPLIPSPFFLSFTSHLSSLPVTLHSYSSLLNQAVLSLWYQFQYCKSPSDTPGLALALHFRATSFVLTDPSAMGMREASHPLGFSFSSSVLKFLSSLQGYPLSEHSKVTETLRRANPSSTEPRK